MSFDEKDRAILKCYSDDPKVNVKDVAKMTSLHFTRVYKRVKRQEMADAIADIKGSLDEIISSGKRLAAKKMKQLVESGDENIALKASTALLKAELSGEAAPQDSVKFITVVNEVGVLETQQATAIDIDIIPSVTKPDH